VDWGRGLLLVSVDDILLSSGRFRGADGPLRQVRLACAGRQDGTRAAGAVWLDDLCLARAVQALRHVRADPDQDEVWLSSGDQLLGRILGADRRGVELEARFGKRPLGWGDVRGLFFRRATPPCQVTEGEHVRLWLRDGGGSEPDRLEGPLTGLDEHALTLRHPLLGEVRLDRGRVRVLRQLFSGKRIELDNGRHRLGPGGKLKLEATVRLTTAPDRARLAVRVAGLKGQADGVGGSLHGGALCTAVVVNGKQVSYLNDEVLRSSPAPQRLRVALPSNCLRAGENTVELRQIPEQKTGQTGSCETSGLVLELPR
jgi:hypothetical protein